MPLYKSIAVNEVTHVLIWKISESETELKAGLDLGVYSKNRLSLMKSEQHRCAYLAVRYLLAIAQYVDADLTYTNEGKPILSDGVHISITHSYNYAAIILSELAVGIDIEKQRQKITLIAPKFISEKEAEYLSGNQNLVQTLTNIGCIKEAVYKLYGIPGLSFKKHIDVAPFEIDSPFTKVAVNYSQNIDFFNADVLNFDDFVCVYVTNS